MLTSLSIQNIVLIEAIELDFDRGLTVLTGETGAGKSILLDSLGLVLGARADKNLIRAGAKTATVTAVFDLPLDHIALNLAEEAGIAADGGELLLRRTLNEKGSGRAFINDHPVSLAMLRMVGATLIERHGQHDDRGLLNPASHRDLLDAFAKLDREADAVRKAYDLWQSAQAALSDRQAAKDRAEAEADFIRLTAEELAELEPLDNEEDTLTTERAELTHAARLAEDLEAAIDILSDGDGLESRLAQAVRRLERAPEEAGHLVKPSAEALDRVLIELPNGSRRTRPRRWWAGSTARRW